MGNGRRGKPGNGTSAGDGNFSLISDAKLISLYRNLLRARKTKRNGKGEAPRVEDAAFVGTAIDLGPGDVVCSLDGDRFVALARANAMPLLLDFNGNGNPGAFRGSNGHLPSPFAHAVIGTALANKTAKNGKVAVIYCAGKSKDGLREAIHIAVVHALPIVFVRQTDGSERTARADKETKKKRNSGDPTPWFPSITVDTNDVVAVYRVANESISRARLGGGPTLIECRALRIGGARNGNGGHAHDPVLNMEHYLRTRGLFDTSLAQAR